MGIGKELQPKVVNGKESIPPACYTLGVKDKRQFSPNSKVTEDTRWVRIEYLSVCELKRA